MSKRRAAAGVSVLLGLTCLLIPRDSLKNGPSTRPVPVSVPSDADASRKSPSPTSARASGVAPTHPSSAQASEAFVAEQESMLRMYEEMADAVELGGDDCDAVAYAFSKAIEAGAPQIETMIERSRSGSVSADISENQLAIAATRMGRLNTALAKVSPDCFARLRPELQKLSEGRL